MEKTGKNRRREKVKVSSSAGSNQWHTASGVTETLTYVRSIWFLALLYSLQLLGTEYKVIISKRSNIQWHISQAHSCFASEPSLMIKVDSPIFPCWSKYLITYRRILACEDHFAHHHFKNRICRDVVKKNSHFPSNDSSIEKNKNKNRK